MKRVLVTGGAGYVGSHTVLELLNDGFEVVVIDNLVNAAPGKDKPESIRRVEKLTGKTCEFVEVDLLDGEGLRNVFKGKGPFDCVIHFAALKSVGESCKFPLKYYKNNATGSVNLLEIMTEFNVKNVVFSSSATVYGNPTYLPIDEKHPTGSCVNPYGKTKHMIEEIMHDVAISDTKWKAIMLRYFNPVGAHASGEIGEDPLGIPNNLMPFIAQVAIGRRKKLGVYGADYETSDGTGVRDYIHVVDLAIGHLAAVRKFDDPEFQGWKAYNLGTGKGNTVLEVVTAYREASKRDIPYEIEKRREGDVAVSYADCSLALRELGWKSEKSLADMCRDSWNWQVKNPNGFVV